MRFAFNGQVVEAKEMENEWISTSTGRFTVKATDKDPYKQGLNLRSEMDYDSDDLKDQRLVIRGSVKASNDCTFVQILGRDVKGQGKPAIVLDTHGGKLNLRMNLFDDKNTMVRYPILDMDEKDHYFAIVLVPQVSVEVYWDFKSVLKKSGKTFFDNTEFTIARGCYVTNSKSKFPKEVVFGHFDAVKVPVLKELVQLLRDGLRGIVDVINVIDIAY